jgi:hypothetical protein
MKQVGLRQSGLGCSRVGWVVAEWVGLWQSGLDCKEWVGLWQDRLDCSKVDWITVE